MTTDTIDIYTDGACKGNPGPGGWGALMRYGDKEKELFGGGQHDQQPHGTDGRDRRTRSAEAAVPGDRAHRLAIRAEGHQRVDPRLEEEGWVTAAKTPVKNADLWKRLDALVAQHEVEWRWVKGHAGHPENERADALANRGVESLTA